MKFLSAIISILIFSISIMPCADVSCVEVENHEAVDQNLSHTSDEQDHQDHCSPLCVCSCCSTVTVKFEMELIEEIPQFEFVNMENDEFKTPFVDQIYYSIWEPPQIV